MRIRNVWLIAGALALAQLSFAQDSSSTAPAQAPSTSTSAQSSSASAQTASETEKQKKEEKKKAKEEKKAKEKAERDAKKKKSANDTLQGQTSVVFNERVADDLLGKIRDGLEGHSRRLMLSAFDDDKMDGYLSFEDQIDAFFDRYAGFRVQFRILNTSVEGDKGVLLVDAQMEEEPAKMSQAPQRKQGQLRFEVENGKKGWRVVDVHDRNFFN